MLKTSLLLLGMLLFNNGSNTEPAVHKETGSATITAEVQEDIQVMNGIIDLKLEKAAHLQLQGKQLLKHNKSSVEGKRLLEEAKLQRLMTLKYKAAIACKMR